MATATDPRARVGDDGVRGMYNPSDTDTLAKARYVAHATSGPEHIQYPPDTSTPLAGVTMEAILPLSWGDVQTAGTARVAAAGPLLLASVRQVNGDTDGKAQAATAGAGTNYAIGGQLRSEAGAEDDEVEVELLGLGTLQQGS